METILLYKVLLVTLISATNAGCIIIIHVHIACLHEFQV